jgi:putative transposase
MPRYLRPPRAHVPIFFTVCLADRASGGLIDHLDILRDAVRATRRDRPFDILAWVVLPDHMHAVWLLPPDDPNYSQRWGRIKARFARDACRAGLVPPPPRSGFRPRKGESGIWQQRFWEHHCRDDADVKAHVRYCWMNPVKHGLAAHPAEWDASSVHRDIRLGLAPSDWSQAEPDGAFGEAA